jgi:hypothetical protein
MPLAMNGAAARRAIWWLFDGILNGGKCLCFVVDFCPFIIVYVIIF